MDTFRGSKEFYKLLFNNVSDAVFVHDILPEGAGQFIAVNDIACQYLGYSREELLQMKVPQIDAPETLASVPAVVERLFKDKHAIWEGVHVSKDGRRIPVEISNVLFDLNGKPTILSTVRDITERKLAEETLRQSEKELNLRNQILEVFLSAPDEEIYSRVLELVLSVLQSPFGIFGYIDHRGNYVCPTLTREIWDQCQMSHKALVFPRATWGGIWGRALIEKNTVCVNHPLPVPAGHIPITRALDVPVLHHDEVIGNLIVANKETDYDKKDTELLETIVRNISPVLHARLARERLEEQLRHSQKMDTIGQLAGGIAHDFNNILTTIIGYGSMLQMQLPEGDPLRTDAALILSSAEKAAYLTKGLLALSRQQIISPEPVRLNAVVEGMGNLLSRIIGEQISLKTVLSAADPVIMADVGQIEQTLINLAANARDAMPGGGVITISTERTVLDRPLPSVQGHVIQPGAYVLLTFADTGTGMDRLTYEKIFEPFFTTKEAGKGTGLGLSIIYGIVRQHKGFIRVESRPGEGTVFRIYFPEQSPARTETVKQEVHLPYKGSETILLAEDEPEVRNLLRLTLTQAGYTVIPAVNGQDAVNKFFQQRDSIQLLIFDVIMPKKDGREARNEIAKVKPDVKTLFLSGYTDDLISMDSVKNEGLHFLSKPILPEELLKKVREILDV
jgi:PAS domain S-box-containing protein